MYRDKLEELEKEAKTPNCSKCFSKASDLFEKQVKLMRSLQICEDTEEGSREFDISEIELNKLVSEICEPVANRQRLLMLKALLEGSKKKFYNYLITKLPNYQISKLPDYLLLKLEKRKLR